METVSVSNNWNNTQMNQFIALYRYSETFWKDVATDNTDPNQVNDIQYLSPEQAVAAADLAGLAIGLGLGPLFGVTVATIASAAEMEDQSNGRSMLVGAEYPESIWYEGAQ
jgi:hypothetical protein